MAAFAGADAHEFGKQVVERHQQLEGGSLEFFMFLPQDNVTPTPEVLQVADEGLSRLLRMPFGLFLSHAVHNASLRRFVDSYLRFLNRPHDAQFGVLDVGPETLCRRVLFYYLRLVHADHEPWWNAWSASPAASEAVQSYGDILYENYVIDVPKVRPTPAARWIARGGAVGMRQLVMVQVDEEGVCVCLCVLV